MSHTGGHLITVALCVLSISIAWADILVNVNVNKAIHDVNEQFVSFSIPPEILFENLDGPNKKTLSEMAALLGPSYLRLTGDFFFPTDLKSNLKNPTQSIWSGFNRWTRTMNWTMIIPVQYTPLSWDPIDALRVLNISNTVGIDNCIWQLGLDFGASKAGDYVADLNTLDTMVDTFRPYVKEWKIIGADVTAGSSAEETKRYIDMSSDVNLAYGWTQPAGYHVEENMNGYIYDKDASLKAMMEKKVPIWLSIPKNGPVTQMSTGYTSTEAPEAIRWAQTLGDAASSGFDAVFKPLTTEDISAPTYSFYVTALFKKTMGNRVFAPKPVKRLSYASKLYTHCANGISGGIAFMGVNTEEYPIKISVRLTAKFTGSEVWQFILTSKKGAVYLNNEELALNSTLEPFVRIKHPNKPLAISMPPMSVGFWVLPLANHEDCQFTELLSTHNQDTQWESRQRRQTSSDRLLKKLILETSLTDQMKNRRRRDTSSNNLNKGSTSSNANLINRRKRFILQDTPVSELSPSKVGLQLPTPDRNLKKREDPATWLKTLVMKPVTIPKIDWGLKRSRRAADFLSSLFPKESLLPTDRRRPFSTNAKQRYNNEESIFKKTIASREVIPEGDVHFQYIQSADGEEINTKASREELEEEKGSPLSTRELPAQFYEAIDHERYRPKSYGKVTPPKAKNDEILDIEGQTKYLTRNQLEKHFNGFQKEPKRAYTPRESRIEQASEANPESMFGPQFSLHRYRALESEDLGKFLPVYESRESEVEKESSPWSTGRRPRRAIGYKLKYLQDNLITKDEHQPSFSYVIPEMSEGVPPEANVDPEEKKTVVANVKSRVSKIIDVVKTHLSGFFNSFVN